MSVHAIHMLFWCIFKLLGGAVANTRNIGILFLLREHVIQKHLNQRALVWRKPQTAESRDVGSVLVHIYKTGGKVLLFYRIDNNYKL